jgi:molybdate transport system substrate-binding protein
VRVPVRRALATGALALLAGCTADANKPQAEVAGTSRAALPKGTVTVFAASSLTESFTSLARAFEARHAGVHVRLVFGPSSDLARQIVQGVHADVYAAASSQSVAPLTTAHRTLGDPAVFARGRLEIAVPAGNPAHIAGLPDLARPGVKFAQCAVEVPCGAAAKKVFDIASLQARPVTYERDVKAVLAKVRLGEVDAGLVYRTDIRAETRASAPKVEGIEIPESAQAVSDYPIVAIKGKAEQGTAIAFVHYVMSGDGRATLTEAGFDAP